MEYGGKLARWFFYMSYGGLVCGMCMQYALDCECKDELDAEYKCDATLDEAVKKYDFVGRT